MFYSSFAFKYISTLVIGYVLVFTSIHFGLKASGFDPCAKRSTERTRKEYIPEVIDEHEVQLTCEGDTITLYLENATVLYEEYLITVEQ